MNSFKAQVWDWNKATFGNIFWRKKRCKARLQGSQHALSIGHRSSLIKLESKLIEELTTILDQEEVYWRQDARMMWLGNGERNTRYFHACASHRKRINIILQLKDSKGSWCDDKSTLMTMAGDFYVNFYTKDPTVSPCP